MTSEPLRREGADGIQTEAASRMTFAAETQTRVIKLKHG
jgi:hypothetical protein